MRRLRLGLLEIVVLLSGCESALCETFSHEPGDNENGGVLEALLTYFAHRTCLALLRSIQSELLATVSAQLRTAALMSPRTLTGPSLAFRIGTVDY